MADFIIHMFAKCSEFYTPFPSVSKWHYFIYLFAEVEKDSFISQARGTQWVPASENYVLQPRKI